MDLAVRGPYLASRLVTLRGAVNYGAAVLALWLVLRLLLCVSSRLRIALFVVLLALPMTIEWAVFRAYGQFASPSDFALFFEGPSVVLAAGGMAVSKPLLALTFGLTVASAWLLPSETRGVARRFVALSAAFVMASLLASALYWRAAPSLEHPTLAFWGSVTGLVTRASVRVQSGDRIDVPPLPPSPGEKRPNIVLIVGESLAASHMSLYGYERPTTPRLDQLAQVGAVLPFRDAVVMGPNTRTSVPYILTGLSGPDPTGRVLRAPTVLAYAKSRGYHTAVVSAQEEGWGNLEALFRASADTFESGLHFAANVDIFKGGDDLAVLEQGVLPRLKALQEPFLLVLHMDGSHLNYGNHSPPTHKVFAEDGVNSVGAYDNTIRVTDEYLARIHEAVRARDAGAWMFFTSDHGQPLGEGGAFFNHGYQTNVVRDPLLVFPPAASTSAAEREAIVHAAKAPVSACDVTPSIAHLLGATPVQRAPMDCADWFASSAAAFVASRVRVVSAYTPTAVREPTMLLLFPDGRRALYEVDHGTVVLNDGITLPMSAVPPPPEIAAHLR